MPTRMVSAMASGSPPHSQEVVVRFGKPCAALRVEAMARGAIVAEQRAAGLAHDLHQRSIGLNVLIAFGLDLFGPCAAIKRRLLQRILHEYRAGRGRAVPWCR